MPINFHDKPFDMRVYTGNLKPIYIELKAGNYKPSTAFIAATDISAIAVTTREDLAALVPFQRHHASHPPTQNVDSAVSPVRPARQFSGSNAIYAAVAVITATKGSPLGQHNLISQYECYEDKALPNGYAVLLSQEACCPQS